MAYNNTAYAQCNTNFLYFLFNPGCWSNTPELAPPVPGSTLPNGNPIPAVPANEEEANQTIQAITNQQIKQWQENAQVFFDSQANNLGEPTSSTAWWKVLLIGAGAVAVVKLIGK